MVERCPVEYADGKVCEEPVEQLQPHLNMKGRHEKADDSVDGAPHWEEWQNRYGDGANDNESADSQDDDTGDDTAVQQVETVDLDDAATEDSDGYPGAWRDLDASDPKEKRAMQNGYILINDDSKECIRRREAAQRGLL